MCFSMCCFIIDVLFILYIIMLLFSLLENSFVLLYSVDEEVLFEDFVVVLYNFIICLMVWYFVLIIRW